MARAIPETITDASTEYLSITAQESTNKPMHVAIRAKYQRLSARDGCGPGSSPSSVTSVRCPGRTGSNLAGAAYGSVAVRLVMFICMFDESVVLDGLNERQRRAAAHQGGPLLVLAGAGTGKTRTLVARAAWLRGSQGVPAGRILLLTFTRRAASDMLARAAAWFDGSADGGEGSGRICGGTFHAIAHKIIRQHAESFSLPPQFTILDQGDATDLMDVLRPDRVEHAAQPRRPRDQRPGLPGARPGQHQQRAPLMGGRQPLPLVQPVKHRALIEHASEHNQPDRRGPVRRAGRV